MRRLIVRAKAMVTRVTARTSWDEIADGALIARDGLIEAIGTFADLQRANPGLPVIGDGTAIMVPGFVNAHHHVGLTPVQLGSPDMPLELWFVTRLVMRSVDPYLDTLYSAFEMIASGVTTVQHIQGLLPGTAPEVGGKVDRIIKAYEDIGMRVSYCYGLRDQNRLVYRADAEFIASLPAELRGPLQRHFDRFRMSLDETMGLFHALRSRHGSKRRVKVQLAPANLHWCSDAALEQLAATSREHAVPLHMHLLETAYQKEYARRRGGGTAVEYLARFGLVNERLTIGHGVWLSEADIERLAEARVCVCHNCSSNFRLRSGTAPLNRLEAHGVATAIGIDEAGINDDRDMLQEMRLVLHAHRVPGMIDEDVPTPAQVLRMATSGGAATTLFGSEIGSLEVGRAADLVLLDWGAISRPYLDPETKLVPALVHRAKSSGVALTMCDGEVIYERGRFPKVDREAALQAIGEDLSRALADDEVERRGLAKALLPYVRDFYRDYIRR